MPPDRITIRVSRRLGQRLESRSRASGKSQSEIVRVAVETFLGTADGSGSAFEAASAAGLIGCAEGLPRDLSTDRRHLEGFGKKK
jgi:metal-responsive CopG/Arc/MetJ family transcriptional regulator